MYASWSGATSTPGLPSRWPSPYAASMQSVSTPGSEARASSSMAVLPCSVSTRRQPARASILAMRSAGKCGSVGWEVAGGWGRPPPPVLKYREAGRQPIQVALGHDAYDRFPGQPALEQGARHPVGARIELAVGELFRAVHGRDRLGPRPSLVLEHFVGPAVGELPVRPGEDRHRALVHLTAPSPSCSRVSRHRASRRSRNGGRLPYVTVRQNHSSGPN